jgi:hypothetical protein
MQYVSDVAVWVSQFYIPELRGLRIIWNNISDRGFDGFENAKRCTGTRSTYLLSSIVPVHSTYSPFVPQSRV